MKKKKITKKPATRVHAFRCTDEVWSQLKALAKECGISLNRYLTEAGLKHHPRQRLTEKFMTWWIRSSAELIQHWYSIEENISSPVLTKE